MKDWYDLTISEKNAFMNVAIKHGITDLAEIRQKYNEFVEGGEIPPETQKVLDKVNTSNANFVQRLKDPNRESIPDWEQKGYIATHKLGVGTDEQGNAYVYPEVQEIDGKLVDFTRPPYLPYAGMISAEERGDTVRIPKFEDALRFTETYKQYYPKGKTFAEGGNLYPELDPMAQYTNRFGDGGPLGRFLNLPSKSKKTVTKFKSLTGKVFNTKEEAIRDNSDAIHGRGTYAPRNKEYTIVLGDNLSKIAQANNIDVDTLLRMNPQIKNKNVIHVGDKIKVGESENKALKNIKDEWKKEKILNTDNLKAIQGVKHADNYVVIDKLNSKLTVYDKNNKPIYETSNISTGKSGNDYNTITYVDKSGKIKSGAGNESTPAGITKITGTGIYHGYTSFTRGRKNGEGYEDIASSLHFGSTKDKKLSNGCVRLSGDALKNLSNFIGIGTDIYTLPEKAGSRFKVKDGKLSFVADNPYGETEGNKKYWDDYNTFTDKSYSPLIIVDKNKTNNETYKKNREKYAEAIENSKERLQKRFNLDSDTYNRLANLALGIAEQETKYGTSKRKILKDMVPDTVLNAIRGNSNRSRGITQIKLHGDNKEMQDIYKELGVTDDTLESPDTAALATMARLSHMYNSEVLGRNFTGANNMTIDPYDALLYKWMGRNAELSEHTATPKINNYISNVKNYQNDFDLYTMRALGGPIVQNATIF